MKAMILSLILIFGLAATNHGKPITTIYSIDDRNLSEEAYVNDIPFNTWEIAVEAILEGDEVKLSDEPYVDDIPFDTRKIACQAMLQEMIETTGEVYIDDIPFSTEKIYCEYLADILTEKFRNEKPVYDLPEGTSYLICTYDQGRRHCYTVTVKPSKTDGLRPARSSRADYSVMQAPKIEVPTVLMKNVNDDPVIIASPGFSL